MATLFYVALPNLAKRTVDLQALSL